MSEQPNSPSQEPVPMQGSRFHPLWVAWVNQPWRWVPTLTLIPLLYGLGWLVMQPVARLIPGLTIPARDLMGTLVSELLFLLVLPSWVRIRWDSAHPWQTLGVRSSQRSEGPGARLRGGLGWAFALLMLITLLSLAGSWGQWLGDLSLAETVHEISNLI